MILWSLIVIPLLAAPLAWWAARASHLLTMWIALCAFAIDGALSLIVWFRYRLPEQSIQGQWMLESHTPWIPQWGIDLQMRTAVIHYGPWTDRQR